MRHAFRVGEHGEAFEMTPNPGPRARMRHSERCMCAGRKKAMSATRTRRQALIGITPRETFYPLGL